MSTRIVVMKRTRRGRVNDWRWSIRAANGNVLGASTQGYSRRAMCLHNLNTVTRGTFTLPDDGPIFTWDFDTAIAMPNFSAKAMSRFLKAQVRR